MSQQEWKLGIDFGTSNTAAAYTDPIKGNIEAVQLEHNRLTMSSSVYLEDESTVAVGDVAFDRATENPSGFIPSPKRLVPQHVFQIRGFDVPSSVPIAAVLKSVVDRSSRNHGGALPSELILTHPEAWSEDEINVLLEAASSLGLSADRIQTVSEPQAAAHYYSTAAVLQPGEKIAVFDFGGGTLDVAVLEAEEDGSFSVVAARGDQNLGGKTLDALIRKWIDTQLEESDPELAEYLRRSAPIAEMYALEDAIRRAKELLSEEASASIAFQAAGENHRIQITRDELESIITPYVNRAVDLTRKTLQEAGVEDPSGIKALYLTGGSSRVPLVQEALKPLGPIATLADPKMVVVQGALSAVRPVVGKITGQNTGFAPRNPSPRTPRVDDTASIPVHKASDTLSSAPQPRKKTPIIAAIAASAVLVIGGAAFAVMSSKPEETTTAAQVTQPDSATTAPVAPQTQVAEDPADTTPETANVKDSEKQEEHKGAETSIRDEAIAAIPAGIKPMLSTCKSGTFILINTPGADCEVDKTSIEAEKYFLFEGLLSNPDVLVAVHDKDVKSLRATIRERRSVEKSYEPESSIVYSIDHGIRDGFDLQYANLNSNLMLKIHGFKDVESAKIFLKDTGLI